MSEDDLPVLPSGLEKYAKEPYGGLFGNSILVDVLEEIVSDPYQNYRPKDLERIIGASAPSIRKSLSSLTSIGILEKDIGDRQHPVYRANLNSKRLIALTFLSLASVDDRDRTNCMDEAIIDYCYRYRLIDRILPLAEATYVKMEYISLKYGQAEEVDSEGEPQVINYISREA